MVERNARATHLHSVPLEAPAVVGVTADGRISRWDRRAEQIYGVSARLMIGMPAIYLAAGNDPLAREWFRNVPRGFSETAVTTLRPRLETVAMRPDHMCAPVSLEAGPLRPRRSTTAALVVVRQLGEHRPDPAAELQALRARVKSWQTAITNSLTLAVVIDEDSLIARVANTATLPSGWSPAHLVGKSPLDFVHPDDRARAGTVLATAMKEPGTYPPVVVKALTREGEPIWIEATLTNALHDPDVRGVIGSFSDVTDQVRDEILVGDHDLADSRERLRFRTRIQHGLRELRPERDLRLAYQPIVDLNTAQPIAVEALLRWHHRKLGTVAPGVFVPLAESSGAIVGIGRWVLSRACRDAKREMDAASGSATPRAMSVNVSSRQLSRASFVDDVTCAIEESGLPAAQLILEVTETAVLDDWEAAAASLTRLSKRGVRVAIDDFGTGYATLKHLKQLPVDIVKIDRSFVAGLGRDDGDMAIVTSVISLAHALGTEVIAEGVETTAQRDILLALGCTHGQGWLFGPAVELSSSE